VVRDRASKRQVVARAAVEEGTSDGAAAMAGHIGKADVGEHGHVVVPWLNGHLRVCRRQDVHVCMRACVGVK